MLITPDLASIRDAQRFFEVTRTLNYGPDKVLIVLNKAGLKGGIRKNEIESALQKKIFAEIPYTGPDPLRALNGGVPLMQKQPRNSASKAIMKLSKEIYSFYEASADSHASSQTVLDETSKLG